MGVPFMASKSYKKHTHSQTRV